MIADRLARGAVAIALVWDEILKPVDGFVESKVEDSEKN
jgi:hypothetical protein